MQHVAVMGSLKTWFGVFIVLILKGYCHDLGLKNKKVSQQPIYIYM